MSAGTQACACQSARTRHKNTSQDGTPSKNFNQIYVHRGARLIVLLGRHCCHEFDRDTCGAGCQAINLIKIMSVWLSTAIAQMQCLGHVADIILSKNWCETKLCPTLCVWVTYM